MAQARIAKRETTERAPRLVKADEPSITDQGTSQVDYLSATLAGVHAIVEGFDEPDPNDEMLHLLYLIEFAQERADKVRLIFDESVRGLERLRVWLVDDPEASHA